MLFSGERKLGSKNAIRHSVEADNPLGNKSSADAVGRPPLDLLTATPDGRQLAAIKLTEFRPSSEAGLQETKGGKLSPF